MRIIHPACIGHLEAKGSKQAIYSLDFQPDGHRLATAGGDCNVKIWDVNRIVKDPKLAASALLATLTSHEKSVSIVRWSPDGTFLASGGDDGNILIHRQLQNSGRSEQWIRCFMLQGHRMNILDLSWSKSGLLASASVDNHVMVWSCKEGDIVQAPMHTLVAHKSHVKGLCFDPLNKFLLSIGADNSVIAWDCGHGFAPIQTLNDVLGNSPDCSLFRRLDWSPDALTVCLPCGVKMGKDVALVLKRGVWLSAADLVGHQSAVTCTRFSPFLYTGDALPKETCSYVAIADTTGNLSVWSSGSSRPLIVLNELFPSQITDLAWQRRRGQETLLAACCITGDILLVDLSDMTRGKELSIEQEEAHTLRHFGPAVQSTALHSAIAMQYAPSSASGMSTIASTSAAHVPPAQDTRDSRPSTLPLPPLPTSPNKVHTVDQSFPGSSATSEETLRLQGLGQTSEGKKRIRPVALDASLQSLPAHPSSLPDTFPSKPLSSTTARDGVMDIDAADRSGLLPGTGPNVKRRKQLRFGDALEESRSVLAFTFRRDEVAMDFLLPALATLDQPTALLRSYPIDLRGGGENSAVCVHAERLHKPRAFHSLQRGGGEYTSIRCVAADTTSPRWNSVVAGIVLCMAAFLHTPTPTDAATDTCTQDGPIPSPGETGSPDREGWVVLGTLDGAVHILELRTGLKILTPLVLGASLVHVSVQASLAQDTIRVQFLGSDGVVHALDMNPHTQHVRRALQCDLRPLCLSIQSSQCISSHGTTPKNTHKEPTPLHIRVQRCTINATTLLPIVSLTSHYEGGEGSQPATTSEYLVYQYHAELQCWQRLGTSSYLMSNLFHISPATTATNGSTPLPASIQASSTDPLPHGTHHSMERMEKEIAEGIQVTAKEVLAMARARVASLTAGREGEPQAINALEWSAYATLCHAEDRVLMAISTATSGEVHRMLHDYITTCCKCQEYGKVEWLLSTLLLQDLSAVPVAANTPPTLRGWCAQQRMHDLQSQIVRNHILPAIAQDTSVPAQILLESAVHALKLLQK